MVKSNSLFSSEKLKSREHYCIINSSRSNKPTSQIYFQKNDFSKNLDWRVIYTLPQKVTTNTYLRSFQYKILNIISYLNEKLFLFGLSAASFCFFCNSFGEIIRYFFRDCTKTKCVWKKLQLKLKDNITPLPLTPPAAFFAFLEADYQSYLIRNHILLISKLYISKSRKSKFLSST